VLSLEATDYEIIEMALDLAAGISAGKLSLILPVPVADAPQVAHEDAPHESARPTKTLSDTVFGLNAELSIALTRVKVPLQRASSFKVGDVLDLDLSSLAQAMVLDANGRVISRGTLGQIDGMRALQVEQGKAKQHTEPRRRASDREALDLPDVTLPLAGATELGGLDSSSSFQEPLTNADLPSMADVDVFGDLGDAADLPDIEEASEAADARMAEYDLAQLEDEPNAQGA
jgi:flagellar motor switch protein FliM